MQASGSSIGRRELCPSSEHTPFDEESAAEQVSYVQSNIFSTGRKSRLRIQLLQPVERLPAAATGHSAGRVSPSSNRWWAERVADVRLLAARVAQ